MTATFAVRLASLRAQAGLTLRQLAALSGLSHVFIWGLENGKRDNPSTETLTALARALDVTVGDLFEETLK